MDDIQAEVAEMKESLARLEIRLGKVGSGNMEERVWQIELPPGSRRRTVGGCTNDGA